MTNNSDNFDDYSSAVHNLEATVRKYNKEQMTACIQVLHLLRTSPEAVSEMDERIIAFVGELAMVGLVFLTTDTIDDVMGAGGDVSK